jgi:hypothetical protein
MYTVTKLANPNILLDAPLSDSLFTISPIYMYSNAAAFIKSYNIFPFAIDDIQAGFS